MVISCRGLFVGTLRCMWDVGFEQPCYDSLHLNKNCLGSSQFPGFNWNTARCWLGVCGMMQLSGCLQQGILAAEFGKAPRADAGS